ncbi:MAG: spondin domain-containing protein [Deinococcales bacterium]
MKVLKVLSRFLALLLTLSLGIAQEAQHDGMMQDRMKHEDMMAKTLTVTITNTSTQVFSPPVVINHDVNYQLFEVAKPALPELIPIAEDGDAHNLNVVAAVLPEIYSVSVADGPLMPGASLDLSIQTSENHPYITVLAMLVTTNDAFLAQTFKLDMMDGHMMMGEDMMHDEGQMMSEDKMDESHDMIAEGKEGDMMHEDMMGEDMMGEDMMHGDMMSHDMMDMSKLRYELHVYDAGSEANNESCTYIPGPPCGNANQRAGHGEGSVQLHQGLMGVGDISVEMYGWSDPVASIILHVE